MIGGLSAFVALNRRLLKRDCCAEMVASRVFTIRSDWYESKKLERHQLDQSLLAKAAALREMVTANCVQLHDADTSR
ncbi:MAG: hypothetical protein WAT53_08075 [Nitrosomonas sp.]